MTDDRQARVLDAATQQFVRYGFRRVTMGDIAQACDMSRPALYTLFPNKEAVFSAALARYTDAALETIRAGLAQHDTLREQLRFAVEVWAVQPFEMLAANPDARELTDCTYGFASDVVAAGTAGFIEIVAAVLAPYADALAARGLGPDSVAGVFARSLKGFKASAADADALRALLDDLVTMTAANCDAPNGAHTTASGG